VAFRIYVDSGVLIKLYVREPNSAAAAAAVRPDMAIPLTPLHELEIRNTFRALEGRRIITAAQRAASEYTFESDIAAGRLRRTIPDWEAVFRRAAELSGAYTAATLARSLDVLHVALAGPGTDLFITADRRQADIARRAELETTLLE
jgi:predicted nucleic acid-binding protein